MIGENLPHQLDTPRHRYVGQPDQACVRLAADIDECAEIGVDRHQDALVIGGPAKDRGIAGIMLEDSKL